MKLSNRIIFVFLLSFFFISFQNTISTLAQDGSLISSENYDRSGIITSEAGNPGYKRPENTQADEYGEVFNNRVLTGFGASGRYVTILDDPILEQSQNGTYEAWVYPVSQTTTHMILSKGSFDFFWGIRSAIGNRMVLNIGNTQLENTGGIAIPINRWTHVAVSWNIVAGNITASFYVDGLLSGTNVTLPGSWSDNSRDLRIGDWHGGSGNFWSGKLDEIRLWDDVRTLSEIRDNRFIGIADVMNSNFDNALTSALPYEGLLASWTFNNSGSSGTFEEINALNGEFIGGVVPVVELNINPIPYNFVLSRQNSSITNYVKVPHNTAFDLTSGGTIECWVNTSDASSAQWFVGKGSSPSTFAFGISSGGFLSLRFGNTSIFNNDGTTIADNKWYHIAAVWSGNPGNYDVSFYVNGKKSGNSVINTDVLNQNTDPLTIGMLLGSGFSGLIGKIDELRIWNSARSEESIRANMFNSSKGFASFTGLIGSWNFDGILTSYGTVTGIDGSFNVGGTNECRFSALANETTPGPINSSFITYNTAINRAAYSIQPFPNGFALNFPFKNITDQSTIRDTIILDVPQTVVLAEVFLKLSHGFAGDLDITLKAPNGTSRVLTSDNGASSKNGYFTFFFDGLTSVTNNSYLPPYSHICGPEEVMGTFGGSPVSGQWILEVTDDAQGNTGVLESWGIRINGWTSIGIEPISGIIPNKFNLFQNYPNPFNPVSNIKFDIAKATNVKLVVFDILGREVATLVNEYTNPGQYEVQFDGANFASGTYFFRIEAGDFTDIKKMVLVK